jgi:hypothetical protein
VTEFDASDGRWVQTLSTGSYLQALLGSGWVHDLLRGSYAFSNPLALGIDGNHVWVCNQKSVTIIAARLPASKASA